MQRLLRGTFLGLALALVAAPGFAQSSTEASATQWGLLGTWARDCNSPPGSSNGYISYILRNGAVVYSRDIGSQQEDFPIEEIAVLGDGSVKIRMNMPSYNQAREFVLHKGTDGRAQVVWNMQVGGDFSVRDTRSVSSGAEMPWQTRCR